MQREVLRLPMPLPAAGSSYYSNWYTVGFVARGATLNPSMIQPQYLEIAANKEYALTVVNKEDLMDPAYNFASYLAMQMAEDLAKVMDQSILYSSAARASSGTFNYDSALWNGIESGSSLAGSVNYITGSGVMSGIVSSLMTIPYLQQMLTAMTELTIDGAEWYFHPRTLWMLRTLFTTLTGTGISTVGPGWPIIDIREPLDFPLWGFKTNPTSRMYGGVDSQAINSNRMIGLFGNLKWCFVGDRMQYGIDTSEHMLFASDQIVFRALQRWAFGVGLPFAFSVLRFPAT